MDGHVGGCGWGLTGRQADRLGKAVTGPAHPRPHTLQSLRRRGEDGGVSCDTRINQLAGRSGEAGGGLWV